VGTGEWFDRGAQFQGRGVLSLLTCSDEFYNLNVIQNILLCSSLNGNKIRQVAVEAFSELPKLTSL
jgi:hypothetical protein